MPPDLKARTKAFALAVLALAREVPRDPVTDSLIGQLVRAGTGVVANYRAACRAKSRADFISKLTTAEEEADESSLWLEVLSESGMIPAKRVEHLLDEADRDHCCVCQNGESEQTLRSPGAGRSGSRSEASMDRAR